MSEAKNEQNKKFWFWLSISINLGFLGVFKYYDFFADSFAEALSLIGINFSPFSLNIVLPVGISFYTFHGLSYVIDIYKDRIKPEKNFVNYSLFVSFFPLLVAGPIERATHLLPQINNARIFDYKKATDGLKQILWGFFKKIVIADQFAEFANQIFNNSNDYGGLVLLCGGILFAFQIYGDFSGYSDIALGTAKLFGIDLLRNFSFPYFSRDIAEFWRRWHISLSTWFRDYLYIPLGGSKVGINKKIRNTFIIFIVSGFWHGANWTFIVWGFLNALFIIPSIIKGSNRNNLDIVAQGRFFPNFKELFAIGFTFFLTVMAWVFFRSEDITQGLQITKDIIGGLFDKQAYVELLNIAVYDFYIILPIIILLVFFLLIEWFSRENTHVLENFGSKWPRLLRWTFFYCLIMVIIYYSGSEQQFIYFQF